MGKELLLGSLRPHIFRRPKGQKPIYLPNHTITLLRTPHAPPTSASFLVPLSFNKLDLKDYLYHLYKIPVLSVRSYIIQQRVQQDKPGKQIPKPRRWFRPRALKKMTVEMAEVGKRGTEGGGAFVWPEMPTDLEPWDKERWDGAQQSNKQLQDKYGPQGAFLDKSDRKSIAEQAKALLTGDTTWRPSSVEFGTQTEVEVGLDVNAR